MINNEDRTLYLNEKRGLIVRRDGPSLWIKEKGRAGRRVPVRYINMVIIMGNIKMDAGTVTLFTENNIPVTFLSLRGESLGIALPGRYHGMSHTERQKRIFGSSHALSQYRMWLASIRRKYQIKTLKNIAYPVALKYSDVGFRDRDYRDCINQAKNHNGQRWQAAHAVIGNLFGEMVIKQIIGAGFDPHIGDREKQSHFGFAHDICYAMLPLVDCLLLRFIESSGTSHFIIDKENNCLLSREGIKYVVQTFEARKGTLLSEINSTLLNFFELLRNV